MKTALAAIGVVLCALGSSAPAGAAESHSLGATYVGTAGGGTVELDTSADGRSVTRFQVAGVATSCGTISSTTTGSFAISGDEFSSGYPSGIGLRFKGTFPAPKSASGVLSLKMAFPSCTSADVAWTATTSTPPPQPSNQFSYSLKGKKLIVKVQASGRVKVAKASNLLKASSAGGGPPKIVVQLKLTGKAKQMLARQGKLKVKTRITFTPDGGVARTKTATLKIKG